MSGITAAYNAPAEKYLRNEKRAQLLTLADGRRWWVPRLSIVVSPENDTAWRTYSRLQSLGVEVGRLQSKLTALEKNIENAQKCFDAALEAKKPELIGKYADKVEALTQERDALEARDFQSELSSAGAEFAFHLLRMAYPQLSEEAIPDLITQRELTNLMRIARGEDGVETGNPPEEQGGG